jgi:hypothetical protein
MAATAAAVLQPALVCGLTLLIVLCAARNGAAVFVRRLHTAALRSQHVRRLREAARRRVRRLTLDCVSPETVAEPLVTLPRKRRGSLHAGTLALAVDGPHSTICVLCLEGIAFDEFVRTLACAHVYHSSCLELWFQKTVEACKPCPLCRVSLDT